MSKPWLKRYASGVPEEISAAKFSNLGELIESSCARHRSRPAFTCMDATLTYGELESESRKVAQFLLNDLGLKSGDVIAIMMPNVLQYPVVMMGALRAGITVTNINPLYTLRELEYQLDDSQAKAVFVLENFAHLAAQVVANRPARKLTVVTTTIGEMLPFVKGMIVDFVVRYVKRMVPSYHLPNAVLLSSVLAKKPENFEPLPMTPDSIAFLQYTGGTTGVAKGAMLTHGNLLANIAQAESWIIDGVEKTNKVIITALPLYHIFSLMANCLTFTKLGGHNILITNPRDIPAFVKTLAKYDFNVITAVNTLFNALLQCQEFRDLNFSSLKFSLGGGMAVQDSVAKEWKAVTGKTITQAYGLTETSPAVSIMPLDMEFNGSIGLALPSTDVSIRSEDGKEVDTGEPGELWVSGPQVMHGYWQRPDETAKVMQDKWFKTGDIAYINEDGFIFIVDRLKDMILVSGFNVYPNEIEEVAASHPAILEVAAIGVPDEHSGEAVKLFVVRKDSSLTSSEIIEFCRRKLTGYKVPKEVEFRDALPKSNVGKILRKELRN